MRPGLPDAYRRFLERHGPFEGFLRDDDMPGYVALWSLEELGANNDDIQIDVYAPGFVAFAGDGGGEVLVFDAAGRVYCLPLIGMASDVASPIAESFDQFACRFDLPA